MITTAEIAARVERDINDAFQAAIADAEQAGDQELAGRIRLDQLAHALEGFTYTRRSR